MDRSRVLFPSLSFAAHITGAAVLVAVPLFMTESLPTESGWGTRPPTIDVVFAASLGGGGPVGAHKPVPEVRPRNDRNLVAPTNTSKVVDVAPIQIELGNGPGIPGLPAGNAVGDGPGDGTGFCLDNCSGVGPGYLPPKADAAAKSDPVRVGGDIREPVKVRNVPPAYPPLAITAHVQGRVVLDAVIDEEGRVSSVSVLKSIPLLDAAAMEAVRQWRYRPTLLNGIPVSVLLTVTVEFRLR